MQKLTEAQERQKHLFKSVLGVDLDAIATKAMAEYNFAMATEFAECAKNLAPLMAAQSGLKKGGWTLVLTNPAVVDIRNLGKE